MFEWKIFPGHTTLKQLQKVQNMMEKDNAQPKKIQRSKSSSCRCTTTLTGDEKAMKNIVYRIRQVLTNMPEDFPKNIGHSSDLDCKKCLSWTILCYNSRHSFGSIWLDKLMSRVYSHPRNDHRSEPKGAYRGNTKNGPVLEVKVTGHFDRCGLGIQIDSVGGDKKTQSWIVISRVLTNT